MHGQHPMAAPTGAASAKGRTRPEALEFISEDGTIASASGNPSPKSGDLARQTLQSVPSTCKSVKSQISLLSADRYAEPGQTLIFFDWDDTLFPTYEIFKCWKLQLNGPDEQDANFASGRTSKATSGRSRFAKCCAACTRALRCCSRKAKVKPFADAQRQGDIEGEQSSEVSHKEMEDLIRAWATSLKEYLDVACSLSDRVVVVTNAKGTWVEECIETFAPQILSYVVHGTAGGQGPGRGKVKLVYAREFLEQLEQKGRFVSQPQGKSGKSGRRNRTEEMTQAKFHAMRYEARAFYKSYPGQSWKNIISIGDMIYEHDAVQELGLARRETSEDTLRIKSLLIPASPSITELTLRLRFSRWMLPIYVQFDGDLQLNLADDDSDPLQVLADALGLPELLDTGFPRHAWGLSAPADEQQTAEALKQVRRLSMEVLGLYEGDA
eukprot:TRINITY_DN54709_c0_g1_i1.p1 TRINITY_DN54709_c0_g1~~TRINITY_DN54709_c0_g1_i1.p1  ORF type:complete len:439 (-),score=64.83 TRINITY_DN54709_c0_g1_i1:87-1403(-)